MSALHVCLFGSICITLDEQTAKLRPGPTAQALLAFLLLHRHRSHRREMLMNLFWSDCDEQRAKRCLSTTIWRLRSELRQATTSTIYIHSPVPGEIGFNIENEYWLDIAVFEEKIAHVLAQPAVQLSSNDAQELTDALKLYTGDLLEGIYDDWVLVERERLRMLHLRGLAHLMIHYRECGSFEQSLVYAQKILDIDPLREEVHREVMRLYLQIGQRAMAVRQFHICRKVLATELGITPMAETRALYHQIAAPSLDLDQQDGPTMARLSTVLQLDTAVRELNDAWISLQRALSVFLSPSE